MSKPLRAYREENGLSREQVAAQLSERLGRPIKPGGVRRYENYDKLPRSWVEALGLSVDSLPPSAAGDLFDFGPGEESAPPGLPEDEPPAPPPGARIAGPPTARPPVLGGAAAALQRIEMAYSAIGAGATLVTQNKGFEEVASHYAPGLAKGWVAAAETNPTVAKIVRFMESGGPVGELVVGHVILILGFAYVAGRGPDLDFLYGRFSGYRAGAVAARVAAEADASLDGSAFGAAEDRVV